MKRSSIVERIGLNWNALVFAARPMAVVGILTGPLWPCFQPPTAGASPVPGDCFDDTQTEVWENGFDIAYEADETFAVLFEEVSEDTFKVGSFRKSLVDRGEDANPDHAWACFDLEGRWDVTELPGYRVPGLERAEIVFGRFESEDRTWSTWLVAHTMYWRATVEGHPEEEIIGNNFIPLFTTATRAAAEWLAEDAYLGVQGYSLIPSTDVPARCGRGNPLWRPPTSARNTGGTIDAQCWAAYQTLILGCNLSRTECHLGCADDTATCLIIACIITEGICVIAGQAQNWKNCAMLCAGVCALKLALCTGKCLASSSACRARALAQFQACTPNWQSFFLIAREDPLLRLATDERMPAPVRELILAEVSKRSLK